MLTYTVYSALNKIVSVFQTIFIMIKNWITITDGAANMLIRIKNELPHSRHIKLLGVASLDLYGKVYLDK